MKNPLEYRVLILPSWYLPEGGEFCLDQALFLKERGVKVHILANVTLPWKKYKLKALTSPWNAFESTEKGILVYRNYYRRIPGLDKANIIGWSKATLKLFDKYVKRYGKPDIIHAHSCMWAGYAAALIKEKYNIPYVVTEHRGRFGMLSSFAKDGFLPFYNKYINKGFSNASYIIPVSDQQIPRIKEFLSTQVPIKIISNILDTKFFSFHARKRKKVFTFTSMNSYDVVKGYDILLPAFDILCDRCNNVVLRIAGDNFQKRDFQNLLAQCRHKEHIVFTGWLNPQEVLVELHDADAFVLSSRVEAQPISVLEAISTGLPVVCTEVVPQSIVSNNEGFRVPIEDVDALANAMYMMVERKDLFDHKSISVHASSIASPEVVTDNLLRIYKEVFAQN